MTSEIKQPLISSENSNRITALRFFLILFVVMNHNNETIKDVFYQGQSGVIEDNLLFWSKAPLLFLSTGLPGCVVPLFLLFSSYFQNKKEYNYVTLLKKKVSSLLVPYFLWIFIAIAIKILPKLIANILFPSHVSDPAFIPIISEWTFTDWVKNLTGYNFTKNGEPFLNAPYIIPLWFIRDMIVLTLLSPLIKLMVKKAPVLFFLALSVKYFFFSSSHCLILFNQSVYFYVLGIYWAKHSETDIFAIADRVKWWEPWPVLIFAWYYDRTHPYVVDGVITVASAIIFLKASKFLISKEKLFSFLSWISTYVFFVYASHRPYLMKCVNKVFHKIIHSDCLFAQYVQYFTVSFATFAVAVMIAVALKKICPKAFRLLNGGR